MKQLLIVIAYALLSCTSMLYLKTFAQSDSEDKDNSLARARELWELAIQAKGGRDRLYQVKSFAVSDDAGTDVDFMVFPDKYFAWADTRPSKIGLVVEMFNFERDLGYTTIGNTPHFDRKGHLGQGMRSRLLDPQLRYLLETRWFKPEVLRAYNDKLNGTQVDVLEIGPIGYGKQFRYKIFLDAENHLPVRIGPLSDERNGEMFDWLDLKDYREIAGIKVPTAITGRLLGTWNKVIIEINPEYDPQVFEKQPDLNAGAFQWRKAGRKQTHQSPPLEQVTQHLSHDDIARYIKDLESKDSERVMSAGRELIGAGEEGIPALTDALKSPNPNLDFFAAAALLSINKENEAAIQAMRNIMLDSSRMGETRQNASFRLMWSERGLAELIGLMNHPDVAVRRCVIFAFDELTELTEIPKQVMQAVPVLRQLLQDKDEVVRGMAKEVLEQIGSHQKEQSTCK